MTEKTKSRVEIIKRLRSLVDSENSLSDTDKCWIESLLISFGTEDLDEVLKTKINEDPHFTYKMYEKLGMIIQDIKTVKPGDIIATISENGISIIKFNKLKNLKKKIKIEYLAMYDSIYDEIYNEKSSICIPSNQFHYYRRTFDYEKDLLDGEHENEDCSREEDVNLDQQDFAKDFINELDELDRELGESLEDLYEEVGQQESEIIGILGDNNTNCHIITLPDSDDEDGYHGIYTYKGRVFVVANGSDSPFWVYEPEFQDKIVDLLKNGKFEIDNSFQ